VQLGVYSCRIEQLLEPNRQCPDAHTRGVIDGIGDGRVSADIAELAQTFDAEVVDDVVFLGNENDFGFVYIGVDRDQVFGQVL
jgi:hypothetical protein